MVETGKDGDVLAELGLTAEDVGWLRGGGRSRILSFLLRWEHFAALHACLDAATARNPTQVSLLDLRARALLAEGRAEEGLEVLRGRLQISVSIPSRVLLARAHLALGQHEDASQILTALLSEAPESVMAWGLVAEVALARRDLARARDACRRLGELNPEGHGYLWAMVCLHRELGDWVTATSYAVGLLGKDAERPLSTTYLRLLLDYFRASGDLAHAAELKARLEGRRAEEQAELAEGPGTGVAREEALPGPPSPEEPEPAREPVAVGDDERDRIVSAVRHWFGFESLLPGQLETMACALRGEDVLAILPTGGGKSLCYQLPALMAESGVTLVVSPLIALMKDQVDSLPERADGLVTYINSSLEGDELRHRLQEASDGRYRLIYAAPERLRQPPFLGVLRRAGVNRMVIDEAHCVSVWGHDFRPDYLAIGQAREALGNPPLLALTATAPERVRRDITANLGQMRVIVGDVIRPNLRLEVLRASNLDDKLGQLIGLCRQESGSGIVYVSTRDRAEELAVLLRGQGVDACHYHAGIPNRDEVQDRFMSGQARIVVATIAFGLGIDKPDIRFIAHFDPPPSLENYYQEAGRAGRDGLPARCVLMYSPADRGVLTRRARRDALEREFLQRTWASVRRRLGGAREGRVAMVDVQRDLQADDVAVRVALGFLERAGLVRRGFDAPRAASVRLEVDDPVDGPPGLAAACAAARLRPGQVLTLDPLQVAARAGLPLNQAESHLVQWANEGWITYHPSGRDLLLELPPPPADSAERVSELLERHAMLQAQRVDDIAAYAETRRCRHGFVGQYFGGRVTQQCSACDNCLGVAAPEVTLPGEAEQLRAILRCLTEARWGWGRVSLVRILRGDSQAPERGKEHSSFGVLAYRSASAVQEMVARLEREGLLAARGLDHGGQVLELTRAGRRALEDPELLGAAVQATPPPRESEDEVAPLSPDDEALFERLRVWRREEARACHLPPFMVLHDSVLRAIATRRPSTPEELIAIKGIGDRKVARYGEAVLEVVRSHLPPSATMRGDGE